MRMLLCVVTVLGAACGGESPPPPPPDVVPPTQQQCMDVTGLTQGQAELCYGPVCTQVETPDGTDAFFCPESACADTCTHRLRIRFDAGEAVWWGRYGP